MKKLYTLLAAVVITASTFAQAPEKMSYQAVVRNSSDLLISNQAVGMQISILQTSPMGTAVYVETHTPTTNINGLVTLEIGTGSVVTGDFTTIDWSADSYFVKIETDPTGGTSYTITGTSQLLSVPYALHAKTADNVEVYTAGEGVDITNNVVTATHPAVQFFNEFNFTSFDYPSPAANLDLGFPFLSEPGYAVAPNEITVLNNGKYLINYDAVIEQNPCGGPTQAELSITINGSTISSSIISSTVGSGGCLEQTSMARSLFLVLNPGDSVSMQFANDFCCSSNEDLRVLSNNFSIVKM